MSVKLSLLALALASSAFAQIDSYGLRAKYGMPLNRETYDVQPGIRIVVDYGPGAQACRIEFGPLIQTTGPEATKQQLDAVVAEVVPPAMRGKELRRFMMQMGIASLSSVEYEHVYISEPGPAGGKISITVTFNNEECRTQPVR